jgi:hypothetical protein
MNLAFGIVLLWVSFACLWTAFHGTTAKTPWEAVQKLAEGIGGGGGSEEGVEGEFIEEVPGEGD